MNIFDFVNYYIISFFCKAHYEKHLTCSLLQAYSKNLILQNSFHNAFYVLKDLEKLVAKHFHNR